MRTLATRSALASVVFLTVLAGCSGGGGGDTTPTPPAAPSAPTALVATPGNGQVTLSWTPVTGATSYNVYFSTAAGVTKASGTKLGGVASPYVHAGRTNGTPYYYVVTAVGAGGESAASPQASATPATNPAPAAPAPVSAAPGNGQVTIGWPAVVGATSYTLYWSTSPGVTKSSGTAIAGVTRPYVQGGLTNGTTYYYVVTAWNANGESTDSAPASATPFDPAAVPPSPPTGVIATAQEELVLLEWEPVDATSYNVYWSLAPGATVAPEFRLSNVTSPYLIPLPNGTTYYFVVTAVNALGESGASAEVSATPTAVAYAISGTVTASGPGRVYVVAASIYGQGWYGTNVAGTGPFAIRGVEPGFYALRAVQDLLGHGVENGSFPYDVRVDPVEITTRSVAGLSLTLGNPAVSTPSAPANLRVAPGDGSAYVSWDERRDPRFLENVSGYDVAWGPDAATSTDRASVDAKDRPEVHLGIANGEWYFRVRSRIGPTLSAWSAPVGPITIGPGAGGSTVSGTVTLPVDATGPLYVMLLGTSSHVRRVASPARSQPYAITGVANGQYEQLFLVDQDRDGTVSAGDLTYQPPYGLVVMGATTSDAVFHAPADAQFQLVTSRMKYGAAEMHWSSVDIQDDRRIVAAATIVAARGEAVPIDLARWPTYARMLPTVMGPPEPGEAIEVALTFGDGGTATRSLPVMGLEYARDLTASPTPSATVPTFSWTAPATPPTGDWGYWLDVTNGSWTWSYVVPAGQTSARFNVDGRADVPALTAGWRYRWSVTVLDEAGNTSQDGADYWP